VITMSSLPPVEPGDSIHVFSPNRELLIQGTVITVDDSGMLLSDHHPYWVPWSSVGFLNLRDSARAQTLVEQHHAARGQGT